MLATLARLGGIGWFVAISIAAGVLGGYWLDGRFGTRPWLAVVGLTLGAAVAFTGMLRMLRSVMGRSSTGQGNGKPGG